jgi:hypothetical protein
VCTQNRIRNQIVIVNTKFSSKNVNSKTREKINLSRLKFKYLFRIIKRPKGIIFEEKKNVKENYIDFFLTPIGKLGTSNIGISIFLFPNT